MKSFVVGNWKMNGTIGETLKMITELSHKLAAEETEVAIAPPFTALYSAHIALQDSPIQLVAQDLHWESEGAYTGEISGLFLRDVGCAYVIVGHSERRGKFGETDEIVNRKIKAALTHELIPIVCIGESLEERRSGKTETTLEMQLKKCLQEVSMKELREMVIAYEPIWAIGRGEPATVSEIEQSHHFIRDCIGKTYDAPTANGVRLLYGGSVLPENASTLARVKNVDGFLVGGASLTVEKFLKIIKAKEES